MQKFFLPAALALMTASALPAQAAGKMVSVEGEVVDTFCAVSEVMFAYGTAHHQCAVWCLSGGIPVSIKDKDGNFYMVLRVEGDETSVVPPKLIKIQTHSVKVDGELIARNGVNYLLVNKIADDKGIINLTHEDVVEGQKRGILPFGE
jgi:hypothetical protein